MAVWRDFAIVGVAIIGAGATDFTDFGVLRGIFFSAFLEERGKRKKRYFKKKCASLFLYIKIILSLKDKSRMRKRIIVKIISNVFKTGLIILRFPLLLPLFLPLA